MQLATIDGEADLTIHNITILPSDQCATEEQRAAKCCCGDGFFYDFPTKKCLVSANVAFMFNRINNGWSHMVVYGFAYPMLVLTLIAPLSAVALGMGKREKREGDRRFVSILSTFFCQIKTTNLAKSSLSNDMVTLLLRMD